MKRLYVAMVMVSCASASPKPEAQQEPQARTGDAANATPQATPDSAFRAQPPSPGPAVEFFAPMPAQLALKNGLPVFLVERHDVPLVAISLAVRSGGWARNAESGVACGVAFPASPARACGSCCASGFGDADAQDTITIAAQSRFIARLPPTPASARVAR